MVQVRIVRHAGRSFRSAPLAIHVRYLARGGVSRTGGAGEFFDRNGEADASAFAARCDGDRHHFRTMISPEDADRLADLRQTTRELMAQVERDLQTRLDWIAADHWNTAHPHVHVLIRGKDDGGRDLVISRDYITRGLRARAEALVSLELGPRSEREISESLQRQVPADRWTDLDRMMRGVAQEGIADLRPGGGVRDVSLRGLLIDRAASLERLGLAHAERPGVWRLAADLEDQLRELSLRGDIVRNLHRAAGLERHLALHGEASEAPIVGRLLERGLFDEQSGGAFVVIDGLDGRAHHVRLRDLEAAGDTPIGGVVELAPQPSGLPPRLLHRSDLTVQAQVSANGATWLDRQLVAREPSPRSDTGFGATVEAALAARREHLATLGLAEPRARGRLASGLLAELRRRELTAAGRRLAAETGLAFEATEEGAQVRGRYRQRVDLASGRFAMIEEGLGFRLVPWASVLHPRLGQEVSGLVQDGQVRWELRRERGLGR